MAARAFHRIAALFFHELCSAVRASSHERVIHFLLNSAFAVDSSDVLAGATCVLRAKMTLLGRLKALRRPRIEPRLGRKETIAQDGTIAIPVWPVHGRPGGGARGHTGRSVTSQIEPPIKEEPGSSEIHFHLCLFGYDQLEEHMLKTPWSSERHEPADAFRR
jgi:hypothetical protein